MKPYRFTLQWPAEGEARQRAGRFLSRHKKSKSQYVILAINAWLDAHPEYEEPSSDAKPLTILTEKEVLALIGKHIERASGLPEHNTPDSSPDVPQEVPVDLLEIISGLELFKT